MAGVACTDVYDLAAEFLGLCAAAVATTPGGLPADCAKYLSPGPPPWDVIPCLVVHVGGPRIADTLPVSPVLAPGHRIALQSEVNLVALTATVLRCSPLSEDGAVPSVADLAASTRETTSDLWAIWAHVKARHREGTLFPPREREVALEPAVAVAAGDAVGWQVTVSVQLDGYTPA